MRRKRLQNVADNLCQIFCGWRLIASKPLLVELGTGVLEIDALKNESNFQGKPIPKLPIADELSLWMQKETSSNDIPVAKILRARLIVQLSFSLIPWNKGTREQFLANGKAIRTQRMHQCTFDCESEIVTDETAYRSKLHDVQQWPEGWPSAET